MIVLNSRLIGARLHASRRFSGSESPGAHVTLPHDAARFRIFRHIIWALQNAILAADALVIEVTDDPGHRIFVIGVHGTAVHARGIKTVVTRGRDRLLNRFGPCSSEKGANVPPCLPFVQAVQTVARSHTRFATGAGIEQVVDQRATFALWRAFQ